MLLCVKRGGTRHDNAGGVCALRGNFAQARSAPRIAKRSPLREPGNGDAGHLPA
jgi:hypothetical protein